MQKDSEEIKNLARQCLAGDTSAWDKLVDKITPLVFYVIEGKFRRLGFSYQESDLEALKQDILLAIWQNGCLAGVKDIDKVIPWICAIAANAASNYARKSNCRPYDLPRAYSLDEATDTYSRSPSDLLAEKELQDDIDSALGLLNYKENLVIKLYVLYGKKYREISEILGMPIGTVLACAARARFKLRRRLRKYKNWE